MKTVFYNSLVKPEYLYDCIQFLFNEFFSGVSKCRLGWVSRRIFWRLLMQIILWLKYPSCFFSRPTVLLLMIVVLYSVGLPDCVQEGSCSLCKLYKGN